MLAFDGGAFSDARRLGWEALELLQGKEAAHDEAAAWRAVGIAAARLKDLSSALEALSRAREAAQRGHDGMVAAAITNNMGAVLHLQGRYAEARDHYAESLSFYERIGAKRQIASLWINLGDLVWLGGDGDWEAASSYWTRAHRLCEEIGDRRNLAVALGNLGEALVQRGDLAAARPYLERTCALARDLGEQELLQDMQRLLAQDEPPV
jgi:tetratricopeptide (TPR) repeat protein